MRNFLGTLGKTPGNVATIIVVAAALTVAVVISSLIARVEKLESGLGTAQAKIVELTDLDHPRVRPLASIPDAWARPRQ